MCVDISHLVLEALGDTDDQVVDEGSDCAEGSDVLSGTVVQFDVDNILLWVGEVDGQVVEVLRELACISSIRSPMSLASHSSFRCVPRGPSTVTSRDLMVTLTIRTQIRQSLLFFQCASLNSPPISNFVPRSEVCSKDEYGQLHSPPSGTVKVSSE